MNEIEDAMVGQTDSKAVVVMFADDSYGDNNHVLTQAQAAWLRDRIDEELALLDGGEVSDANRSSPGERSESGGGSITPETPAADEIDVDGHPPGEMMGSPEYHTQQDEDEGGDPDDIQDGARAEEGSSEADDVDECTCPECGEEFKSERGVNIHRTKAHGDDADGDDDADGEGEDHECPTCGEGFDSSVGMEVHHSREHDVVVDERSDDDAAAAAEGSEDGPEPETDEDDDQDEDDPGAAALRRRLDEREEIDGEQKGDEDRVDDDARNGGENPADTEVPCPVCGESFGNAGTMRSHRDDDHDETEVARAYREQVREDLPRNVSIVDIEQSVAAHGTVYEVQQDLRVPRKQLKPMIGKLQLTDALEEHGETQAIHMIEDLHDELGIDEPVPEVPAADGGEAA